MTDSWKRPDDYKPERYPEQLKLQLNHTTPATPKEFEEWQEKELSWWAERQFTAVIIATIVQISALGFMAAVMLFNQQAFG